MKYNILIVTSIILSLFFISSSAKAQHNTNSPYSMFGLGDIEGRSYGLTGGMANTGIGMRLPNFLNTSNAAAITTIDTLRFVLDVGITGRSSYFKYGSMRDDAKSMNVNKFAIGFRASSKWMMNLGIRSFSNVGYKLRTEDPIEGGGTTFATTYFEGTGGLNRFYLTNAYRLTKKISLGVTTSYLFGDIDKKEIANQYVIQSSEFSKKIYFDLGVQYTNVFKDKYTFTAGATYGYKAKLRSSNVKTITDASGMILYDKAVPSTYNYIPQYFGAGVSLSTVTPKSRMWVVAADYMFQNWANIKSDIPQGYKFVNSHKINGGLQYIPNARMPRNYFQHMRYQLGASYNASHMKISGTRMQEYAVTAGLGLPLRSGALINFSAEYGYKGGKGLVKENYVLFTLSGSISEIWFVKRLYN